jgi:hypothetical protein
MGIKFDKGDRGEFFDEFIDAQALTFCEFF